MLKNAPFLITIGVDTAENEPRKESWVVARSASPVRSRGTRDDGKDVCPGCGEAPLGEHAEQIGLRALFSANGATSCRALAVFSDTKTMQKFQKNYDLKT